MSVTVLRRQKARHPAREALAQQQNALIGSARAMEVGRINAERGRDLRDQAAARLAEVTEAAASARSTHHEAMLASARTGNAVALASTMRDLRHAETDAAADLEAAASALATLEAEHADATEAFQRAKNGVGAAVGEVLQAEVPNLRQRAAEHLDQLIEIARILRAIDRTDNFAQNLMLFIGRTRNIPINVPPPPDEWVAAVAALHEDADAPLPSIGGR